jgi:hypothetical protein
MDIENNYEQELIFKIEIKNDKEKKLMVRKKIDNLTSKNLKKFILCKLDGKTGNC